MNEKNRRTWKNVLKAFKTKKSIKPNSNFDDLYNSNFLDPNSNYNNLYISIFLLVPWKSQQKASYKSKFSYVFWSQFNLFVFHQKRFFFFSSKKWEMGKQMNEKKRRIWKNKNVSKMIKKPLKKSINPP